MAVESLSVDDLVWHCQEETARFRQQQAHDAPYCFELMRRALHKGVSEAFTRLYQILEPQVQRWVYNHPRFEQTGENVDYFVSVALSNYYFALRGPKFGDFASFARLLSYLKLCVHTAIAQYVRDQRPESAVPLDEVGDAVQITDFGSEVQADELWAYVCQLLPDPQDRLVANWVFVQGLKPAQIVKDHPGTWRDEREVSVALQRIRRLLRRDGKLRQWAGGESTIN